MTQTQPTNITSVTPVLVEIADMITLDKSTLINDPLIARATRPYDEKYAKTLSERLALIPVTQWTPLEATETDEGLVILDGQHRLHSAQMREYPVDASNLERTEKPVELPVLIRQFSSHAEIAARAYKANMEHGKAYDTGTRTAYAIALYHHLEEVRGEKPSERYVAKEAGISNVALNAALKKEAKKQVQEASTEGAMVDEDTANKVLVDDTKKLVKLLTSYHSDYVLSAQTDTEAITSISAALLLIKIDFDVLAKASDILIKSIKQAKKEAEKQAKGKPANTSETQPAKKSKKSAGDKFTQTTLEGQIADSEQETQPA